MEFLLSISYYTQRLEANRMVCLAFERKAFKNDMLARSYGLFIGCILHQGLLVLVTFTDEAFQFRAKDMMIGWRPSRHIPLSQLRAVGVLFCSITIHTPYRCSLVYFEVKNGCLTQIFSTVQKVAAILSAHQQGLSYILAVDKASSHLVNHHSVLSTRFTCNFSAPPRMIICAGF